MKMMKVFDSQEMPQEVCNYFFEHSEAGNDCYLKVFVEPEVLADGTLVYTPVVTWLMQNGAEIWDEVLVSHWW